MKNESIESLKQEKESILFFEEKMDILTMPIDKYFEQVKKGPGVIPVAFILGLNGIENDRLLYVFDLIGIRNTNNMYPNNMDREAYMKFIQKTDEALAENGLSTGGTMLYEQRKIFDSIVRKREEVQKGIPQRMSFEKWYSLVRRVVYGKYPQNIAMYLINRNKETLMKITYYVAEKCSYMKLSEEVIIQFMKEAIDKEDITLEELRYFDPEQYKKDNTFPVRRPK